MNVINYITITCNLKNVRLQITFDYMKNVIDYNRLRLPRRNVIDYIHFDPVIMVTFCTGVGSSINNKV
jgi:hypothetical protein